MDRVFGKNDLIAAYVEARRNDHPHASFETYYKALFETLQNAFGIRMSHDAISSFDGKVFFVLFNQVVSSYIRLTARDGLLEGGLLETKIEGLGETGLSINQKREKIWDFRQQSVSLHLELLAQVFDLIWGPLERTVTDNDLKRLGFDLEPPNIADFWDEM